MAANLPLLDAPMLARLKRLPLRARGAVEGYVAGAHRSPFHGFSIEFAEHREYAPGDDLRHLDWKALARTDRYYLKRFEEETNLICHLLVDASESMAYRGPSSPLTKLDYARQAAAALAYLVLHQQDSVGLSIVDAEIRRSLRPSGNPSHLRDLLEVLEGTAAGRKTALGPILHDVAERLKRRGIVVVLSDFLDDVDAVAAGLKHLRHRRHEVIVMHVLDPAEIDFPFDQPTMFRGLEGLPGVLAEPRSIRRSYMAEFDGYLRRLQAACRAEAIDYVLLRTDRSLEIALASYLASRRS